MKRNLLTVLITLMMTMLTCTVHAVSVSPRQILVDAEGSMLRVPYSSNYALNNTPNHITFAIIIIHGTDRNAGDYYSYIEASATAVLGSSDDILIIAPQFLAESDIEEHNLANDFAYWTESSWKQGDRSRSTIENPRPGRVSSFSVIEQIAQEIATESPDIGTIVMAGHSAGGQFVQRFAAGGQVTQEIKYIVANPSSYLYFDNTRRINDTFYQFAIPDAASCAGYNEYRYGLEDLNQFMGNVGAEQLGVRYQQKDVVYLLGCNDDNTASSCTCGTDPVSNCLDVCCQANLQGDHRLERGVVFYEHLLTSFGESISTNHTKALVSNVGHSGNGMFNSPCGRYHLFEGQTDSVLASSCASPEISIKETSPQVADIASGDDLDFGIRDVHSPRVITLTVENTGDGELTISTIDISEDDGVQFSYASFSENTALAPGAAMTLDISYLASEAGSHAADLRINSDDCDEGSYLIVLKGGANRFSDVDVEKHWAAPYIAFAVEQGIVEGIGGGPTFGPDERATRAQALKMAYIASGQQPTQQGGNCLGPQVFPDVPLDVWYCSYVADAHGKGYVDGKECAFDPGQMCFFPDEDISRGEAVTLISKVFQVTPPPPSGSLFDDVDPGNPDHFFAPYVHWMKLHAQLEDLPANVLPSRIENGERVLEGFKDGTFRPEIRSPSPDPDDPDYGYVLRGQMAKISSLMLLLCRPDLGENACADAQGTSSPQSVSRVAATGHSSTFVGELYEQISDADNFNAPDSFELPGGGTSRTITGPLAVNTAPSYDDDGHQLFYFWVADGGVLDTADPVNAREVSWTPPSSVSVDTTFTIKAIAGDGYGQINRSVFRLTVPGGGQNAPPAIAITEPAAQDTLATENYLIQWTAEDPDSNATISLYYDFDSSGLDGIPIGGAGNLDEDDLGQFVWDTSAITPGTYFIYAKIDDGVNPPQYSYSAGSVRVESVVNQPVDPYNWRMTEHAPGMNYQGIGYGDGAYVAVGKKAAISLSGNEGLSWGHHDSTIITDDMDFYDADYHNGRWILVGEDNVGGLIIYSDHVDPDGSTYGWVIPNQWYGDSVRDIHYANGKWVAVGHSNLVMYSTDNGATWNQGSIIGSSYHFKFTAVTYDISSDTWIAVSESSYARSQVATSSDGINWYQRDFFNTTYRLRGVASYGGQAVAVGYKTTAGDKEVILTSSNGGLTWTDASAGSQALFDVVYRPDGWVAVGNGDVATSDDGISWHREPSNLPGSMNAVVYAPEENNLVAVLHSRIYRARIVGSSLHRLMEVQIFGSGTADGVGFSTCSDYCVDSYIEGSVLRLTATPATGWLHEEWGGSCSGTNTLTCDIILTENEAIDVVFGVDDAPTISLIEPDGVLDKAHQSYTITWTDSDPDSSANILLYHDLDADGVNGTLITQGAILEDDESDRYLWDTSSLPEDDYYIYALINDGINLPVKSVGSGPITVIHNEPPRLMFLEPDGVDDTEDLSYTLVWTAQDSDNDASIDLFYDADNAGADGAPIPGAQDLSENDGTDQYVWNIANLPEQDFYVYAVISDGVMDPYTVYSPGPLSVLHVSTNVPPSLSFVEPDGVSDTADQSYDIVWIDEDPDNNADIFLFYDSDNLGADGQSINLVAVSEDDEIDLFTWDTSSLPNGDYYVYAVIDDHVRPPVMAYSSGPLAVSHANAVPSITLQEPDGANDSADQTFTITWTDDDPDNDATISLYYDVDDTGADGTLIVEGLSEDDETDSYSWNTAGINGDDYYIYAMIDDGSHSPVAVYSTGQVSVDHAGYGVAWARQAGSPARDWAYAVASDSVGNSYVTGYHQGDILFGSILLTRKDAREAFLVKYDSGGTALWGYNFGLQDDSYGRGLAVDAANNVYVAGYFENAMQFAGTTLTATGATDVFVAKFDSRGDLIWARQFGTSGWSEALALAVSDNGDVYHTGTFTGQIGFGSTTFAADGINDIFVAKLNTNGQAQWARRAGSSATSDNEEGYGIDVDAGGNVYVTGRFMETATFGGLSVTAVDYNPDIFVARYSSSGSAQWVRSAGGTGYDQGSALAVSGDGFVYVTGNFERDANFSGLPLSSAGHTDIFVAKYSTSSGNISWVRSGRGSSDDRGHAISVASSSSIVVAGQFSNSVEFDDIRLDGVGGFVAQYSADGGVDWARPTPWGSGRGYGVASDNAKDLIVVGFLSGVASFDQMEFTSLGDADVYVAKVDRATISNSSPVIDIVEPDGLGDVVAETYAITWTDADPDDDAQILLYSDVDATGADGTLITPVALSEDDLSDQYLWDVSALTPGDYYIYARIQDSTNPAVIVYSDGPLTVDPTGGNTAPMLSIVEPDGINDLAAHSYLITWSDDDPDSDATIDLFYDTDSNPGGGVAIVSGLSENDGADSYVWSTSGVADGEYYIYGVIDDGVAPAVVAYSSGVVRLDSTPARVIGVSSIEDTGDGLLAEGELTSAKVWQLLVTFDEGMWNPPGDSTPGDVTSPSSYRLSIDLGDGFDPVGCAAGEDPDDLSVVVSYAAAGRSATLSLPGAGLPDGAYRLLVCGTLVDEAGNGLDGDGDGTGGDDFARIFTVDVTPPRVMSVESTPDTGDGTLAEGEVTNLPLTELRVKLDEVAYDPPGDGGADDVTNPDNYLLFTNGGDDFDTADCTLGVAAGDVPVTIDGVTYSAVDDVATLAINGGAPLAEGRYRLQVCGTTSISDPAGNALDGNGDGSGGDDFTRSFLIDTSAPAAASGLTSPSHPVGVPVNATTIEVSWNPAVDALSGVAGYAFAFDAVAGWVCDQTQDLEETATGVSSPVLPSGSWYFHLCAVDLAGNWSAVATAGPFLVRIEHNLSMTTDGAGAGSILVSPGGTSCSGICTESFPENTNVTLSPSPAAGSAFADWSGDCAGIGTCDLKMDADKTVTATFEPCTYTLSQFNILAPRAGLQASVDVAAPAGCPWTAASQAPFVTLSSGASGTGNGTVTFDVASNAGGLHRLGAIEIAGKTFMVYQAGIQISAGGNHSVFLQDDGTLLAWGKNDRGQLADGTTVRRSYPASVLDGTGAPLGGIASVSTKSGHILFLTDDGDVLASGINTHGQAGETPFTDRLLPGAVLDEQGLPLGVVVDVAAGEGHSVALLADGSVVAWGYGERLGDGTLEDRASAAPVTYEDGSPVREAVAITAGYGHSHALLADGSVVGWGLNGGGQLADGTFVNPRPWAVPTAVQVGEVAQGFSPVEGGRGFGFARDPGSVLVGWGVNSYGQRGDGTTASSSVPVAVQDESGVSILDAVAADGGYYHGVALRQDGTLLAWGRNHKGQLGDGTTTDRHRAVQVVDEAGLAVGDVVLVSAGSYHNLALLGDGTLLAWGYNGSGQLGDGTRSDRHHPVVANGAGAQLALTLTDAPDPVGALTDMTLTLDVTNLGRGTANQVVLDLGTDAIVTGATGNGWSCSTGTHTAQCTASSLPLGLAASVTVEMSVPSGSSTLTHTATVSAAEVDPKPADNTASETTQVYNSPPTLEPVGGPFTVNAGEFLSFTVVASDPDGDVLTFSLSNAPPGASIGPQTGVFTWMPADAQAGQTYSLDVVVTDDDPSNPLNDSETVQISVTQSADVSLTLGDSSDPVEVGTELTYTLSVTNQGPSGTTNSVVTLTLPAGVSFVGSSGCVEDPAGFPSCSLGPIAAGQSAQYTLTVSPSNTGEIVTTACVTSDVPVADPGNNCATETTTVESLDVDPPTVTKIDTVLGTGDGRLSACESARTSVSRILLTFNEALHDPPGDVDPNDVTNPDNYALLASGADQDFGTDLCGTLFGDDVPITLGAVTWDEPSRTTTLTLTEAPLADAPYRLIACGSTSLYDLAGNPLDGDGDGVGGDDFLMDFRVDRGNVFDNGHLDCGLASWIRVSTNPDEVAFDTEDVDGSSFSGSAHLSNLTGSTYFALSQCVPVAQAIPHALAAKIRFLASPGVSADLSGTCEYFEGAACTGTSLGLGQGAQTLTDNGGEWVLFEGVWTSPSGSTSAKCTYGLTVPGGESFDAFLDELTLQEREEIFADGFESGNTSVWDSTVN